eukprot:TRINITY_DN4506_c0_g1_i1.p1 TRINITY_DN4506_c0_g1~~TRINITY_DN4506_c0_g1_i1.p1  ORF type:complete len:313 (-),score=102.33 TRINITY_DN4506_c0_g1_i1:64-1002(-)
MSNPTHGTVIQKEGGGGGAALQIDLHPLVIINMSDHFTRAKVEATTQTAPRVIGAILGTQNGRNLEISNSFELVFNTIDGLVVIDFDYLRRKQEQFKTVFPNIEFLGWYSTGTSVSPSDIEVHRQFIEFNESPVYLLIDAQAAYNPQVRDIPITIFESELHVVQDKPTFLFVKVPYRIQTGEAERIGVDHVARVTPGGSGGSQLAAHLVGLHNAIKMLNTRVKTLHEFLQNEGQNSQQNHGILRQIASLCHMLPAIDTPGFQADFLKEYNDVLLVTYLASITKGTSNINELVDKFNTAFERHSRPGRRTGFI